MPGCSGATGETWHPCFMALSLCCDSVLMESIKKLSYKEPCEVVALEVGQSCLLLNLGSDLCGEDMT